MFIYRYKANSHVDIHIYIHIHDINKLTLYLTIIRSNLSRIYPVTNDQARKRVQNTKYQSEVLSELMSIVIITNTKYILSLSLTFN